MSLRRAGLLSSLLSLLSLPARADEPVVADDPARRWSARLSLSALILGESDDGNGADPAARDASTTLLGWGELRAVVAGRNLGPGFSLLLDARLRLSGDFSRADALVGKTQVTSRGYLHGREYDLRQAWVGWRPVTAVELGLGRLLVREADALLIDGARVWIHFSPRWQASLFGGLYPDPFARSVVDDYAGTGVAGAAGAAVSYRYPRAWGSLAAVATFFTGPDDGGAIPSMTHRESARVFVSSTGWLRPAAWLDLFHDLVLDAASAVGPQLNRLDVGANARVWRLTLALSYHHLSSLAVETYLVRLLNDRRTYLPGTIENNLVVERTARDEGRLRAEVRPVGRLSVWGEARLRRRALVEPDADPAFLGVAPRLAWDVTIGVRSSGDLARLRLAAAFTEITDFRAETQLVTASAGRDLWGDRLSLDASFAWARNRDSGVGLPCTSPSGTLDPGCFGRRTGQLVQGGLTVALVPTARWLLLGDYRLVVDTADGGRTIITHVGFLRLELRL